MKNFELLNEYRYQLEKAKKHREKLFRTILEGFKNKYGPFDGKISLHELGLLEDYENYLKETNILEEKIQFELNQSIGEFAKEFAQLDIKINYLVDYRIHFRNYYDYNEMKHSDYQLTTVEQVQMFIMQCENDFSLSDRINQLIKEPFFFNIKDAIVEKGKANYEKVIRIAERNLKSINIFDKSNKITIIGKVIKNRFEHYYRINEDPINKQYFFSLKGINLNKLTEFYFDFLNLDSNTKNEILENFNNDKNTIEDLTVLEQFAVELRNRSINEKNS
jgi:hypothetical protein